jgi:hypothetical protein
MKSKIILIGVGGIGARHFESLLKSGPNIQIEVRDFQQNLNSLLSNYRNQINQFGRDNVDLIETSSPFKSDAYNLGIIATGASERSIVLSELLTQARLDNLILEKPIANSLHGILEISKLIKNTQDARVNFPRESMNFYKTVKQILFDKNKGDSSYSATIEGSNWGIVSNCLHFVRLVHFLTGIEVYEILDIDILEIYETKRLGYFDFYGRITFADSLGNKLSLIDSKENREFEISIKAQNDEVKIFEHQGFAQNAVGVVVRGEIEYQSNLTAEYFDFSSNEIIATLPTASDYLKVNENVIKILGAQNFPSIRGILKFT